MTATPIGQAYALAFTAGFTTLAFQVLVHRMVSAKLLNNFAFLVISLTMLGFAASGVILSRWLKNILRRFSDSMSIFATLFVISAIACTHFFYAADAGLQTQAATRWESVVQLLEILPLALLYAVPFTFSGLILGAVLSDETLPARKIYFFDLAGSCLGAVLAIPAMYLGVEYAALLCCAVLLLGTLCAARPRSLAAWGLCGVAALAIMSGFAYPQTIFALRYPSDSILAAAVNSKGKYKIEHVLWDPVARIELTHFENGFPMKAMPYSSLVGDDKNFHKSFQKILTQNNFAFTFAIRYNGDPASLKGIDRTIYAAAYAAKTVEKPKVAVIGVGGGFDILTALYYSPQSVTGIEINAATLRVLKELERDYFAPWVQDPRVKLEYADGRHFLAASPETYDIIQLSGVDSYSGSSASAHVFSENFLYTAEAFDLYYSRLTANGVMNLMRLEQTPPAEMLKALTSAIQSLRRAGVSDPWRHIAMVMADNQNFAALLVKKSPFKPEESQRLQAWAGDNPNFKLAAAPGFKPSVPNGYQVYLALNDPAAESLFIRDYTFDITPCTDDRPFFFRHTFWWHLYPTSPDWLWKYVPRGEYLLLVLVLLIGAAALLFILTPLFLLAGVPNQKGAGRYGVIFACTALGFMAIEIALLQKFGLFLGHPNYALSVILSALLLGTGLGALFSERIHAALRGQRGIALALCGIVVAELLLVPLVNAGVSLPFAVRAVIAALLAIAPGLLMGTFVPLALTQLKRAAPAFVPWAWGVNGVISVLAPVLSVALAMTYGSAALACAALPFYLLAGWLYPTDSGVPGEATQIGVAASTPSSAP